MTDVEIERLRKVAWGVVANAGRLSPKRKPRWSHVMDATGQGSTAALGLCREYGFDPDEEVGTDRVVSTDGECDQCVEYESVIEESLPEYVYDDGSDEPASYTERIEYAGRDAKAYERAKAEIERLKARVARLTDAVFAGRRRVDLDEDADRSRPDVCWGCKQTGCRGECL